MIDNPKDQPNIEIPDVLDEYYSSTELSETEEKELSEKVDVKVKKVKNRISFVRQIAALKNYMMDVKVKWYKKSVVVAALIYFITPIDSIPDFVPFLGYLDDIGVIAWTVRFLSKELSEYLS